MFYRRGSVDTGGIPITSEDAPRMDHTIVHFEIPADDPQRAIGFYSSLFGWDIQESGMPGVEYWMFAASKNEQGQPTLGGGVMRRQAPGQQIGNYISVESVDDYTAKAQSLGAEVLVPKMEVGGHGWFAQLKDPEGNVFALWEAAEHNGSAS